MTPRHHGQLLAVPARREHVEKNIDRTKCIVEIGSDRDCGSTKDWGNFAKKLGMKFISVDIDPEISSQAEKIMKGVGGSYEVVCMDGVKFLNSFSDGIGLIYLDAFDFWHPHHSKKRLKAYENRGTSITNKNSWAMHLGCAESLSKTMDIGDFICFDDIITGAPEWAGKGKTAMPYFLDNGFKLNWHQDEVAFLERVK